MLDEKTLNDQFTDVLQCPITGIPYYMVTKIKNRDIFLKWAYEIIYRPEEHKTQLIIKGINDMTIVDDKKLKCVVLSEAEISSDHPMNHKIGFFIKYPMSPHIKTVLNILFNCKSVQLIFFDFTFHLASLIEAGFNVKSSNIIDLQAINKPADYNMYFKKFYCRSLIDSVRNFIQNGPYSEFEVFSQNEQYLSKKTHLDEIKNRYYQDNPGKFEKYLFSKEYCKSSAVQCVIIGIYYLKLLQTLPPPFPQILQNTKAKYSVFMDIMKKYNNPMAPMLEKNWYYLPKALNYPLSDCFKYVYDEKEAYRVISKAQSMLNHYELYKQMVPNPKTQSQLEEYIKITLQIAQHIQTENFLL